MLITLKEILSLAETQNMAIGAFNTPNIASVAAVVEAAEELAVPVILMHGECHESLVPLAVIGPVLLAAARQAKVPVCVHLDHGETVEYIKTAIDMGFGGVMYDGSALEYDMNVANTRQVVEYARRTGVSVEAEIGSLGKREMGMPEDENDLDAPALVYTDPALAGRFVRDTGIDALACSFGTVHGLYFDEPKLDLAILDQVRAIADIPLVMHGGSGISDADFRAAIDRGIRKINYFTYLSKAGGESVRDRIMQNQDLEQPLPVYYHDIVSWAKQAMKENAMAAMEIFSVRKPD
jgi:fructose-bisphosphate aldolase class II